MKCKDCSYCKEYYHTYYNIVARCIWFCRDTNSNNECCDYIKPKSGDIKEKVRATR